MTRSNVQSIPVAGTSNKATAELKVDPARQFGVVGKISLLRPFHTTSDAGFAALHSKTDQSKYFTSDEAALIPFPLATSGFAFLGSVAWAISESLTL